MAEKNTNKRIKSITSYGIILFYIERDQDENITNIYFLLVQRRDNYEYMDLITGNWKTRDDLQKLIANMSNKERSRLCKYDFDNIWEDLFINKESFYYRECYQKSKSKFETIRPSIPEFIEHCSCINNSPPWGFPKGKKDANEGPVHCALREFCEETGHKLDVNNVTRKTFSEFYTGNNGKQYCTHYYLAQSHELFDCSKVEIPNGVIRKRMISDEVGNMGWYDLPSSLSKLPSHRFGLLQNVYNYIMQVYNE